ncbi:MAG: hypothetical protein VX290_19095 [Candidatus Latescibacterota bacterium]|nr:hypothetical protein [Candidatus Latescibacterota bacterium]
MKPSVIKRRWIIIGQWVIACGWLGIISAEAQQVPAVEVHPFGTLDLRMHAGSGRGVEVNRLCRGDSPGLEVAATAKDRSVDAVIMLMTGWEFDAGQVEGGRIVDLVLSKPFERDTVIERVRDAQQMVESRRTVVRDMAG